MKLGLWLLLLLITPRSFGSPAEEWEEKRIPILDKVHDLLDTRINSIANNFDAFFATERADDELGRSRVRIAGNYLLQERGLPSHDVDYRFNLKLPQLQNKFRELLRRKRDVNDASDEEEKEESITRLDEINELDTRWIFNADANVSVAIPPRVIVRARARKSAQTGTLIHRFVQESTWTSSEEGFAQGTTYFVDHTYDDDLLFRFNNDVNWRITEKNFSTSHSPTLFQRIDDFSAITYSVGLATTVFNGAWYVSNYSVAPSYRRTLYRTIAYLDLSAGLNFPKEYSFRRNPFVFAGLEFLFGSE
jgi:hypothetical protein